MVPLSVVELRTRADQIQRSVDNAVRDLLEGEVDPFALAIYLWTIRRHDVSLVNGDRLAAWGVGWTYQVLIEREIGPRADETIASAALAAAVTTKRRSSLDIADVMGGLQDLLSAELSTRTIPLKNATYAATLLFAAQLVDLPEPRIGQAATAVAASFAETISYGRTFGIGFAVRLLQEHHLAGHLASLDGAIRKALTNPQMGYEDQLYLVQALLQLHRPAAVPATLVELAESVITKSPIWSYLMFGVEDVEPAGDGRIAVPISHLYRAGLLDVTLQLLANAAKRDEARRDVRYRGRVANGVLASLGMILMLAIPWMLLSWAMAPSIDEARRYWLRNEYNAMTPGAALLCLLGFLGTLFLLMLTVVVIWTLWSLLIRSAVESDRRMFEVMGRRLRKVGKVWIAASTILVGVANEPLLHALGAL